MRRVTFNTRNTPFYDTLKARVDQYFNDNKLSKTGNLFLYIKAAFFLIVAAGLYTHLVFFTPESIWQAVFECIVLGFFFAGIGFNAMHDGAHGSFSKYKWVNECMAFTLNILGGNSFLWKAKHNVVHHTFTNIDGLDDDIDIKPWMRTSETQERLAMHRFQHIYWFILYGLTYILWVFYLDFVKYFSGKILTTKFQKMSNTEHFVFWMSKMMYVLFLIVIPILFLGVAKAIIGYVLTSAVTGVVIGVVFQLAHVVEGATFPVPDEQTGKMNSEWATHQIATTANFATKSKIVNFFVGGLNFQVEHHLFPRISHVHYPKINKIIKDTCDEFNLKYLEYQTVGKAIQAHVSHLKAMGR